MKDEKRKNNYTGKKYSRCGKENRRLSILTSVGRVRGGRGIINGVVLLLFVVPSTGNEFATSVSSSTDDIDVSFLPRIEEIIKKSTLIESHSVILLVLFVLKTLIEVHRVFLSF